MYEELSGLAEIIAYCLMPNHYHILLYTKPDLNDQQSKVLNRKIGTLQSSYTQAYNKRFQKTGSLFQQKVKRKCLNNQADQAVICFHYIHQNPLKAGLVKLMQNWEFSSFKDYINEVACKIINRKIAYDLLAIPEDKAMFLNESLGVIVFDEGY